MNRPSASSGSVVRSDLLKNGDEVGTPPSDRRFRRDVQGLRAVAVVLVVLYHANFHLISGGYVGVDVFFVISGFVITGVLLRGAKADGTVGFADFYARRSRRIIPAAAATILLVIFLAFHFNGVIYGSIAAIDGRWAAVFLANFHFASVAGNYLLNRHTPSPLLNFWSLAVEEQFYLVYPALFLGVLALKVRRSLEQRLAVVLTIVIVASYTLSVVQTASNPTFAFYSPFTRAWELAIGGLVACSAVWIARAPETFRSACTWIGLAAIAFAALSFTKATPYPGSLVAVPVVGAALVIFGGTGTQRPRRSAETILGTLPFQAGGRISYSWYLWHWPILVLAAEHVGQTHLRFRSNLPWLALGLGAAVVSYFALENPIRHATSLRKVPWKSIALGLAITVVTFAIATASSNGDDHRAAGPAIAAMVVSSHVTPAPADLARTVFAVHSDTSVSPKVVHERVVASSSIVALPSDLVPPLAKAQKDVGIPVTSPCWLDNYDQWQAPVCTYGDTAARGAMVLFGDSHAAMWFGVLDKMARAAHIRLVFFSKAACPVAEVPLTNPTTQHGPWTACDKWRAASIARINALRPQLVVIGEAPPDVAGVGIHASARQVTAASWGAGVTASLGQIDVAPRSRFVIGNVPPHVAGPVCLSQHTSNVQACSVPAGYNVSRFSTAEAGAVAASGSTFVDAWPWLCATTCSSVIGRYVTYFDPWHVTNTSALTLQGVLARALNS